MLIEEDKDRFTKIFVRSRYYWKINFTSNLVDLKKKDQQKYLARYNRQRAVTISANINENYTLLKQLNILEDIMAEVAPKIKLLGKVNLKK